MEFLKDVNITERLTNLIKRRGVDLNENVKYRGKLRTVKAMVYIAEPKSKLLDYLHL